MKKAQEMLQYHLVANRVYNISLVSKSHYILKNLQCGTPMEGGDILKDKLKALIDKSGETVYRVSKETGISQTAIHEWMEGTYTPKLENLRLLADHFKVPLSYFID